MKSEFCTDDLNNKNKLIDIIIDERSKLNYNNNILEAYKSKYINSEELKDIINSQLLIIQDMEKDRSNYMKELSDVKFKYNENINNIIQSIRLSRISPLVCLCYWKTN
jgi:hypothetical protein